MIFFFVVLLRRIVRNSSVGLVGLEEESGAGSRLLVDLERDGILGTESCLRVEI